METRKFWEPVTNAIVKKDYKQATAHKQTIEQAQRDKAAAREKSGEKWVFVSLFYYFGNQGMADACRLQLQVRACPL
jgi:hypothetical protein